MSKKPNWIMVTGTIDHAIESKTSGVIIMENTYKHEGEEVVVVSKNIFGKDPRESWGRYFLTLPVKLVLSGVMFALIGGAMVVDLVTLGKTHLLDKIGSGLR
jgi:hypothetical protein